jgi:hypothetical protein
VDIREPSVTTTDGWHKTWSETYKKDAVQHDSLPSFLFKYPFPLFPAAKADSSYSFSCFLEFEAEACMLFLGASNLTSPVLRQSQQVDLFDGLGRWVGVIEPTYVREEQYEGGIPCDLIAISEGWTTRFEDHESEPDFIQHQPFEEMERVQEIKVLEEYHFYNVLWIDRIGGVAYRNGMGRVWKGAWTQQNTKIEKIVLG